MKTPAPENESQEAARQRWERRLIEHCWREARKDYRDAGMPFGPSQRAFKLWIVCEQRTTCN